MHEILSTRSLCPGIKLFEVSAPLVARKAEAGEFVIIRVDDKGERIPLTIVDWSRHRGSIAIVFQEIGRSTKKLGRLKAGEKILNLVGPLGKPIEKRLYGTTICVAGGVGIGAIYPIARALKASRNRVVTIIGARSKELLFFEEELRSVSDELYVATDDGSKGTKGFVTDVLKNLLQSLRTDMVYSVGPVLMMKAVAEVTRPYGIKTIASLNPIMIDGTGMCGCCRVIVGGRMMFTCVDGPDFDAHEVDFENLLARNRRFLEEEALALKKDLV
ncbi:MAG: sulfide/dihydroorotate dehydrogenase-like FAD/NAD-binding protein [Candidatus Bathyarchaeia archaeon]